MSDAQNLALAADMGAIACTTISDVWHRNLHIFLTLVVLYSHHKAISPVFLTRVILHLDELSLHDFDRKFPDAPFLTISHIFEINFIAASSMVAWKSESKILAKTSLTSGPALYQVCSADCRILI